MIGVEDLYNTVETDCAHRDDKDIRHWGSSGTRGNTVGAAAQWETAVAAAMVISLITALGLLRKVAQQHDQRLS